MEVYLGLDYSEEVNNLSMELDALSFATFVLENVLNNWERNPEYLVYPPVRNKHAITQDDIEIHFQRLQFLKEYLTFGLNELADLTSYEDFQEVKNLTIRQ